jgi:hypothetical protein
MNRDETQNTNAVVPPRDVCKGDIGNATPTMYSEVPHSVRAIVESPISFAGK